MAAIYSPSLDEVVSSIRNNDGMVHDDHYRGMEPESVRVKKAYAVAQYGEHVVLLSAPTDTPYFCLNRMTIDEDGKPHLSTFSVGGVVDFRRGDRRIGLDQAVSIYNDPDSWMPGFAYTKITNVVYL